MSTPRNKGLLPDEVTVLRSRVDGFELSVKELRSAIVYIGVAVLLLCLILIWRPSAVGSR